MNYYGRWLITFLSQFLLSWVWDESLRIIDKHSRVEPSPSSHNNAAWFLYAYHEHLTNDI